MYRTSFFFINVLLLWLVAYIFIAHDVWTYTDKIRVLIHSPFCVMNFMSPVCRPNSAAVFGITQEAGQG
jgi:hypothetical protein